MLPKFDLEIVLSIIKYVYYQYIVLIDCPLEPPVEVKKVWKNLTAEGFEMVWSFVSITISPSLFTIFFVTWLAFNGFNSFSTIIH